MAIAAGARLTIAASTAVLRKPDTGLPPWLEMAIEDGDTGIAMYIGIAEAKNRLTQLIRAVEHGESIVITRNGTPVAQLAPPPPKRRPVRFDGMKDRIRLLPGWDDPIDLDRFLEGDL